MAKHLELELEKIKSKLLLIGEMVEENLQSSVSHIRNLDLQSTQQAYEKDFQIDLKEVELEEDVLKTLALYQPVAGDLRFLVMALKINNDLERIGDTACSLASRAAYLSKLPKIKPPFDFETMSKKTIEMVDNSIKALIKLDVDLARQICKDDDIVDKINRDTYPVVFSEIKNSPENAQQLIHYLSISRFLERISDLATNIAEDIIYMIDGIIVRHNPDGTRSEL